MYCDPWISGQKARLYPWENWVYWGPLIFGQKARLYPWKIGCIVSPGFPCKKQGYTLGKLGVLGPLDFWLKSTAIPLENWVYWDPLTFGQKARLYPFKIGSIETHGFWTKKQGYTIGKLSGLGPLDFRPKSKAIPLENWVYCDPWISGQKARLYPW